MIIHNNIIPFKGFYAINICGIIFVRGDAKLSDIELRHEKIHTEQIKEMFVVGFYLWYLVEFMIRLCLYRNRYKAYRNLFLEKEAYTFQGMSDYLTSRHHYKWLFS